MSAKSTIRRALFITVWLCIGGGMLTLLLAAISKKNKGVCKEIIISIKGAKDNRFIDEQDVSQLLMSATGGKMKGQPVTAFRLHDLGQTLEANTWIDEAELYFDNQNVLHVTVTEKEPRARVFTTEGNSFYVDSVGRTIPLSDKLSARVPVFTGFPGRKKLTGADSVLLTHVRDLANYINNDPFWKLQVAQVDISADKTFEMIPLVGNHVIKLGNGEDLQAKFRRLNLFYRQVLMKTGIDRYKVIDVQYKGQVVASRFAGDAKVDSVQLRKNVEKLLRQSMESQRDTVNSYRPQPTMKLEADSAIQADPVLTDKDAVNVEQSNPNPLKSASSRDLDNKNQKDNSSGDRNQRRPKAVMPKRNQ